MTFLAVTCLFSFLSAQAPYFNEWYVQNPHRPFVKVQVFEDGMYALLSSDLLAAGHDLSQAHPDSIQMYYRGEEVPLVVDTNGQGQLASVTFYGRRNDGAVETQMYRNPITAFPDPSGQPNPNFSLYSDTAAYFLTWGSEAGLRYQTVLDTNYAQYIPETAFPTEVVWEPHPDSGGVHQAVAVIGGGGAYDSFHSLNSDFVTGEGYVSQSSFKLGTPFTTSFLQTPFPVASPQDVRFQFRIFHRSNTTHHLRVNLANAALTNVIDTSITFSYINVKTYERTLSIALTAQTDLTFEALQSPQDDNHLTFIRIRYQRLPDLLGKATARISELTGNFARYFRFTNAQGQNSVWVYDPENQVRYQGIMNQGNAQVILNGRFYGKSLEVVTDQGLKTPIVAPAAKLRNLCSVASETEFLIIAHRNLAASAEAYASYRDTTTAGFEPLTAKVIYIDEIYHEFGYGAPTPQAIQQFVNCALDNWNTQLKYVFLWGKGKVFNRGDATSPTILSYGYPANDVRFTTPWGEDLTAQVPIGRLNIFNDQEGLAYLDKVMEFEQLGAEAWRKKALFLGGGANAGGQNAITNGIGKYIACFEDSTAINGRAYYFQKGRDTLTSQNYSDTINAGIGLLFIFAEPSSNLIDTDIGEAFEYQNIGKYPLFINFGGYGGDFTGRESFGERWVKEPQKGAIAYLSNSSAAYINPLRDYGNILFCQNLIKYYNQPIGKTVMKTYQQMLDSLPGIQYRNHARQMNLQGDPSLVIFPFGPVLSIPPDLATDITIYPNPATSQLTISSPTALIEAVRLFNLHGQEVLRRENIYSQKVQLMLQDLRAGQYIVWYRTQNGVGAKQVILE